MKNKSLPTILSLTTLYLILSTGLTAQNVVITDDDTYTPTSTNALLEVKPGSNDKGVLIPRLTTTERTAITMSAANDKGLMVYDTDTKSFWFYDGTSWKEIGATSSGMADADGDTKIQVEESADEDNIRFDVAGTETVVIDENGKVGIGSDNPFNKLDVIGDVGILGSSTDAEGLKLQTDYTNGQTSSRLFFCETHDNEHGFSWIYAGDTDPTFDGIQQTLTTNTFYLARNNNSTTADVVMSFLRNNGNVGIGVNNPSKKLEVDGEVKIGAYTLPATDGTSGHQLTTDGSGNVSWSASSGLWSENGGNLYRSSGFIGIGTSTPANDLHIRRSGDASILIEADSDNNGEGDQPELIFSQDGGAVKTYLGNFNEENAFSIIQTYNDDIQFFTDSAERLAIKGDGKVGIGTSTPSALLEVSQQGGYANETVDQQQASSSAAFYEQTLLWQSFTAGASGYLSKVDLWDGGNSNGTFTMKIYQGQGTGGTLLGTANTVSRNNNGWEYVSFTFPNPISVTATQQYTFAVTVSGIRWHLFYSDTNPYNGGVVYFAGSIYSSDDTMFKTYVASSYSGAGSFVIKDNGNVGVGTITPSQKLEVDGNILQTDGHYIATDLIRAIDGDGLKLYEDGGTGLFIDDGGNVGIGTSSPSQKLEVDGNILQTDGYYTATDHIRAIDADGLKLYDDGGNGIFIEDEGQVGIGTTTPGAKLDLGSVATSADEDALKIGVDGEYAASFKFFDDDDEANQHFKMSFSASNQDLKFHSDDTDNILYLDNSGNVGIGTGSPTCPLEIDGSTAQSYTNVGYLTQSGAASTPGTLSSDFSIKASNSIAASSFIAFSDKRIKTNITGSNISTNLKKVKQLRLTHYNYIDSIAKDRKQQKGFIAQEVEKILPEAVNISSGFVPDIFVLATQIQKHDDKIIIEIQKEHRLQQGDILRLITKAGHIETEVLELISETSFAVYLDQEPESIFVYGKKVDDFRAVNYDYIFSTGIGAIQELSKQVEELKSLKVENVRLRAEMTSMKSDLSEIKALLGQTAINE